MIKKIIKLSIITIWLFIGLLIVAPNVFAENETKMVSIDIKAVFDDENEVNIYENPVTYGTSLTVSYSPDGDYNFAFWVVNGIVRRDLSETTSFYATETLNAIAVYHSNNKWAVLYTDFSGKLIDINYVLDNGESTAPSELTKYNKIGYNIDGFKLVVGSTDLNNIQENTVYRLTYTKIEEGDGAKDMVPIWVNNIENSNNQYLFNEIVTLKISDYNISSEEFSHWEEEGKIISYDEEFSFSALYPRGFDIIIKEESTPKKSSPLITLGHHLNDEDRVEGGFREGYISRIGQFFLPSNYELIEAGYLVSDGTAIGELTLENNTKIIRANPHNFTNEFLISFKEDLYPITRAYMIIKENSSENLEIFYSELTKEDKYALNLNFEVELPELDNPNEDIYLVGNFGEFSNIYPTWVPGDESLKMERNGYQASLTLSLVFNYGKSGNGDEHKLEYQYYHQPTEEVNEDTKWNYQEDRSIDNDDNNRPYEIHDSWALQQNYSIAISDKVIKWRHIDEFYIYFEFKLSGMDTNYEYYLSGNFKDFGDYEDWGLDDKLKLYGTEESGLFVSNNIKLKVRFDNIETQILLFKFRRKKGENDFWENHPGNRDWEFDNFAYLNQLKLENEIFVEMSANDVSFNE